MLIFKVKDTIPNADKLISRQIRLYSSTSQHKQILKLLIRHTKRLDTL